VSTKHIVTDVGRDFAGKTMLKQVL
jgi:hypothetical protein